jgi:hypothetical protein
MTKAKRIWPALLLIMTTAATSGQTIYFPNRLFDQDAKWDKFTSDWYGGQLKALQEPSLLSLSKDKTTQSYRFLWLRTFHHPVSVRIDIHADGTALLTTKIASGAGGYAPGHLITNTSKPLTKTETQVFLNKVDKEKFWMQPVKPKGPLGEDGSEWIIEGVKDGKYHLASRWTPSNGPIYDLGFDLAFRLAGLTIPKSEMY